MEAFPPRVSIGMPVYNGEKYLEGAFTALLQQDFADFELIVSDNASTDGTQEICRAFAQKDRRVRYVRNGTNIGLGANHNRTIALARGEFFKWAAHDDDFPRAMLARFVRVFDEAPASVSLVYSHCEYIDELGTVQGIDSDGVDKDDPWPHRRLAHLLTHVHMYNSPYGLMRSQVLRKTRLHGLYPMADHVLLAELAMLGVLLEIPEPLLRIRRHPGRTFTANKARTALREIFTPGQGQRFSPLGLRTRMHLELVRSALMVPASSRDKILCTGVALAVPQWWRFRGFGGIQKRKLLRMFGSGRLSVSDIKDLPMLATKLKSPGPYARVSQYLVSQLSPATRDRLSKYSGGVDFELRKALVEDFNRLIEGGAIYDAKRFGGVILSPAVQRVLEQDPHGASLVRLNRLLLEEVYPQELSRNWRFSLGARRC